MKMGFIIANKKTLSRLMLIFGIVVYAFQSSCADMNKNRNFVKKTQLQKEERPVELLLTDIEYGQTETITLQLPHDASGSVDFSVSGKGSYPEIQVVDGKASIELSDLELGIYPVVASYSGDSKYPSVVKEGDFAVIKSPKISVIKTSTPTNGYAYDLEEQISYKIQFSFYLRDNTDFTISDPLSREEWHTGAVQEGNFEYSVAYHVKEVDIDRGEVRTLIEARGILTTPESEEIVVRSDIVRDPTVARTAHLYISVLTDPISGLYVGDVVNQSIRVLNNGNITVSSISLVDDHSGNSWSVPVLAPGEHADFAQNYTVTQADFDTSSFSFVFRVNGISLYGANPPEGSLDVAVTTADCSSEISIVKEATPTSGVGRGDVINYHVIVTNVGDISVKDGVLVDDHVDLSAKTFNLAPGETAEFDYSYTVIQADVDAGQIVNVVRANATAVRGDDPEEVEATSSVNAEDPSAELSITKIATPASGARTGDTIIYSVNVRNTGNVSVKDGVLNDDHVDLSTETFNLAPGEDKVFVYNYIVTQADMDTGEIVNTVYANATAVRGEDPEEVMATSTTVAKDPSASLHVLYSVDHSNGVSVGEVITYHISVINTGDISVFDGSLRSNIVDLSDRSFALAPGEIAEFEHTYTVTSADVSHGMVGNHIRANATAVRGSDPNEAYSISILTTSH